jgi:Zn-dependent protease with chaperone function/uncharacterized RDD family membrane protein YckC
VVEEALFKGPESVRVHGERAALVWSIVLMPLTIGLIGAIFKSVTPSDLALLVVGGMVFVSISRGRLLGSSIRIDASQFPETFAIVERVAAKLGVETPQVFIRDDVFVPISAVGMGDPYSLIISSQYLEHLREGELAFLIARELGHIAAGHTRLTSLLSASGRENPAIALIFGAWLRRTEYTGDRVGLICGASLEDAVGAIAITTFHAIGRRVDIARLAEQQRELEADPTLRMGEWVGGVPYATKRIAALRIFDESPLAQTWRARLAQPRVIAADEPGEIVHPESVSRRECAPVTRRALAFGIDMLVVGAIVKNIDLVNIVSDESAKPVARQVTVEGVKIATHVAGDAFVGISSILLSFLIYSAILVALTGQTLGMMVMELRVVTTKYRRPTIAQTLWRYVTGGVSLITTLALVGFFMRIHPHDYLSRTRLVRGRSAAARTKPLRIKTG